MECSPSPPDGIHDGVVRVAEGNVIAEHARHINRARRLRTLLALSILGVRKRGVFLQKNLRVTCRKFSALLGLIRLTLSYERVS